MKKNCRTYRSFRYPPLRPGEGVTGGKGDAMKKQVLIAFAILLAAVQASIAGMVIDQRVKDGEGKQMQVILYCSGDRLRTDHLESGLTTVMDFKDDQIFLIDHPSKNYFSMKLSLWEREMAARLKKTNPGVRREERPITVRRFGETATLNGFKTEKVQVLAGVEVIEEHWMTRDIDMSEVDRLMEKANQGFSREFRSESREGREIQQKLKPHGFSILVRDLSSTYGLGGIDVLEVKRIEQKELKNEVFTPPSGYSRIVPQPPEK